MINSQIPPITVSASIVMNLEPPTLVVAFRVGNFRVRVSLAYEEGFGYIGGENLGRCIPPDEAISLVEYVTSPRFQSLVENNPDPDYLDCSQGERLAQLRVAMINKIMEHTLLPQSTPTK